MMFNSSEHLHVKYTSLASTTLRTAALGYPANYTLYHFLSLLFAWLLAVLQDIWKKTVFARCVR